VGVAARSLSCRRVRVFVRRVDLRIRARAISLITVRDERNRNYACGA